MGSDIEDLDIAAAFKPDKPDQELDYVILGLLLGTVGALVSSGGVGKSFWALQAAMWVAAGVTGSDLLGLGPGRPGRVLFLAAEDPRQILNRRFRAIGRHLTEDAIQAVTDNLVVELDLGKRIDLMTKEQTARIIGRGEGARLIVIDPLSQYHSLDENSNSEMAALVGTLNHVADQTGAAVLFLHHVSKGAARSGINSQLASRGASVLVDNVRWSANLSRMTEAEAAKRGVKGDIGSYVCLSVAKQNYGEPPPPRWYKRHEGGVLLPADLSATKTSRRTHGVVKQRQAVPSR